MKRVATYLLILFIIASSCKEILFNDDQGTIEIEVANFKTVRIKGIYDIILIQDSTDRVVLSGNRKINLADVSVVGDTLVINGDGTSLQPGRNKLELHFTTIDFITTYDPVNMSNAGIIKADYLLWHAIGEIAEGFLRVDCNYFKVINSANTLGTLHFQGKAGTCMIFNRYGSSIFAGDLESERGEIINESVGAVYINASERLKATILGNGNIYYYGNPEIEIVKKGRGNLVRLEN
jgi:hypothetical protein